MKKIGALLLVNLFLINVVTADDSGSLFKSLLQTKGQVMEIDKEINRLEKRIVELNGEKGSVLN
jgi:hypothetical protein